LAWLFDYIKVRSNPIDVEAAVLQRYKGTYGPAKIIFDDAELWVIQPGRTEKQFLLAMTEDTFIIGGDPDVRIKFEKKQIGRGHCRPWIIFRWLNRPPVQEKMIKRKKMILWFISQMSTGIKL